MLSRIFDQPMSRRLIRKIVFTDGEAVAREGLRVDYYDGYENADACICWDETGIWLTSNATITSPDDHLGMQGREDLLANIQAIEFMPDSC